MNDNKKDRTQCKNEKVGADGLTKKERRALKVQERKEVNHAEKTHVEPNSDSSNVKPKSNISNVEPNLNKSNKESKDSKMSKSDAEQNQGESVPNNMMILKNSVEALRSSVEALKVDGRSVDADGKTKAQLKLERKALFEQQKAQEVGKAKTEEKGKEGVSKAQLRAERRALQEKQREAKEKAKAEGKDAGKVKAEGKGLGKTEGKGDSKAESKGDGKAETKGNDKAKAVNKGSTNNKEEGKDVKSLKKTVEPTSRLDRNSPKKDVKRIASKIKHQVQMFNHLYYQTDAECQTALHHGIHPAFVQLGVQYCTRTVLGSNARCLALLSALRRAVTDYSAPTNQEYCRSFETYLQSCVAYLHRCRPLAVSMMNALRHFKLRLTHLGISCTEIDSRKKEELVDFIDTYVENEIEKAGKAISMKVDDKIADGDVILTYACSSLITRILLDAHKNGKKFHVIVVDARPISEGQGMVTRLLSAGISCSYVLINGVSFVMSKVSKILLGAHALLSNGYVMSRIGTAQIALLGQEYSKPVLVCCETYKFCERVQTDSYVYNEIGDPDKLIGGTTSIECLSFTNWRESDNVVPLNLTFDVTPPDLVTAVVTELGFLPCTSVPVVLRIKPME